MVPHKSTPFAGKQDGNPQSTPVVVVVVAVVVIVMELEKVVVVVLVLVVSVSSALLPEPLETDMLATVSQLTRTTSQPSAAAHPPENFILNRLFWWVGTSARCSQLSPMEEKPETCCSWVCTDDDQRGRATHPSSRASTFFKKGRSENAFGRKICGKEQ